MKTKFSYKLISLLAALCMLLALIPVFTLPAAASTAATLTYYTIGAQDGEGAAKNRYLIYFDVSGIDKEWVAANDNNNLWNNNTVYIDGVATSVNYNVSNSSRIFMIIKYDAVESSSGLTSASSVGEHLMHIKAGTPLGNTGYTIANDIYLKINGYTCTPLSPVNITDLGTRAAQANRYYVSFKTDVTFNSSGATPNVDVLIDGVSANVQTWWNKNAENDYGFVVLLPYTDAASGTNHTVVVPAGTLIGGLVAATDFTFYIHANGNISTEPPAPTAITITDLGTRAAQANRYYVSFKTDVTFNSSGATPNVDVLIDGVSTTVNTWWHENAANDYGFVVLLPYTVAASGTNHTVVVPAGTKIGGLPTTADFTFYLHANGDISTEAPTPTITGVGSYGYTGVNYLVGLAGSEGYTGGDITQIRATVDGAAKTLYAIKHTLGGVTYATLVLPNLASADYHEIVLSAGNLGNSTFVLENDLTLYAYKGVVSTTCPLQKVAITHKAAAVQTAPHRLYIAVNLDTALQEAFWSGALTAYIDGVATFVNFSAANSYIQVSSSVFGASTMTEITGKHIVEFRKGTIVASNGNGGQKSILLTTSLKYLYDADAGSITLLSNEDVTITGLGAYAVQDDQNRFIVNWTLSKAYGQTSVKNISVLVNGQPKTIDLFDSGDNVLAIFLYTICPKGGKYEITVPKDTVIDGSLLTESFTFYIHSDNAINTTRPSATVETVTMTVATGSTHNNPTLNAGFYFYGSGDSLAYADDWKTRYSFIEGGIYVNDALISGAQLIKIDSSNLYYVAFDNCGVTPFADGTTVRIAGTVKNGYFDQVVFEEKTFIYKANSGWKEKAFVGTLELLNASAMMGGSYGDTIYYDLTGSYGSANWIINAVPTAGNITFSYVVNQETRGGDSLGVYGVARMINANSYWATQNGVIDFIANNGNTATWTSVAGGNKIKLFYNAATHRRLLNDSIKWGYPISEYPIPKYEGDNTVLSTGDAGGNPGLTTAYENADAAGAQYFGVAWGGGTYDIDWTKLMIYDAEGNDLGVQWHDNAANAALSMMVEYGKTAYVKALPKTDKFGTTLAVIGWKGYDSEGNELTVTATENNGVWSFVVPQDLAKLEPQYQTTSLTITVGGQTIKTDDVLWTDDALANAGVFAGEGQKLLGYIYNGNLYSSLSDINTASAAEVVIEAMMVEFEVQTKEEIRYGADMYNSGLRFIATLTNLYDGVHVVEKGFLLTTMDKAKAGLTLETEGVLKISSQNAAYSEIDSVDDTASYSIALTNIKAENYNLPYAARAYFVVEYADGTRQTIYSTFDSAENATTVFNVASASNGAVPQAYEDGFIDITADGDLIGDRSYTISFDKNSYIVTYDYTPAVTGATFVKSFSLNSVRMTTADGVIFEDGKITIPSGLFAMSLLEKELKPVRALSFNAYGGPSSGWALKTDKYGNQTEYQYERSTVEDLKDYFDAGFTVWSADDWWAGQDKDGNGKEDHLDALDLMAAYCLTYNKDPKDYKVILHDSYLWGLMSGEDMIGGNEEFSYRTTEWSAQFMKARIFGTGNGDFGNILGYANYVPVVNGVEYPELNCFGGLTLRDEPHIEHMKTMAEWFNYLAADTDESVTVSSVLWTGETGTHTANALGMLKQGYQLYFSMISPQAEKKYVVRYSTSEEPCTPAQYENYANTFIDAVNASCWEYDNMYIAFNCYPYQVNYTISKDGMFGSTTTTKNQFYLSTALAEPYFWANKYRDKDIRLMAAIQSFAFDRLSQLDRRAPLFGGSVTTLNSTDVMQSAAEVQAQVYQGLVNGIQEFNYFTYWRHYNGNVYKGETHTQSAVYYDSNGNAVKDEMYYWVKDTNQEVLKFKDLYTSFDWEEAGYFAGTETQSNLTNMDDLLTGATNVLNASALKAVSGSVDTLVGYFTKAEGDFRSAFMVANGHNAREQKTDNVTLTFDEGSNVTDVIVYLDGAPKMMSVSGGQVTLTLAPGEGAFVIPVIG